MRGIYYLKWSVISAVLKWRTITIRGVVPIRGNTIVYTSCIKTDFWGVSGKVHWTCFSHLHVRLKKPVLKELVQTNFVSGSVRTLCCYTFLHCRSNTPFTLAVLSSFPFLQWRHVKPCPHFTSTGNLQLPVKIVQKNGPMSQKLLVKKILKSSGCSKPHKDHIDARK